LAFGDEDNRNSQQDIHKITIMAKPTTEDRQLIAALGGTPVPGIDRDTGYLTVDAPPPEAANFIFACRWIYNQELWKTSFAAFQCGRPLLRSGLLQTNLYTTYSRSMMLCDVA